jgi:UDP-galactopyranose mutase
MKKIKTDFLVVGSGFYGSVIAERISSILKKNVLILEKRNHIGGNCFSEYDKSTNIEYHKYGTHIFHTSNNVVWNYINQFTSFNSYKHQVLSNFKNKIFQMPINLETINSFFKKNFTPIEGENYILKISKKYKKKTYNNFEEKALSQIGKELYTAFIKSYTEKQWNDNPKNLPSSIFNRLPLRFNYDENYFKNCIWQGIPHDGYTEVFNKLLDNRRIKLIHKTFELENQYDVKYMTIYTGPLDRLFNYKHGNLKWRSLSFKKKVISLKDYQGTAVINYPEKKYKFTRIHEPKHLHSDRKYSHNKTLIIYEYPKTSTNEPYYPVNDLENRLLHRKYKSMALKIPKFDIGGRLADYAYYDMDMTISAALQKFERIKKIFK